MSDPAKPRQMSPSKAGTVKEAEIIFDCPMCHKGMAVDQATAGRQVTCPSCGQKIIVPQKSRVVPLAEDPETKKLQARPAWEQELAGIESALRETQQQRQEAGNFYKHHVSEANRQKLRVEKLDARIKELESRRAAIRSEHPS